MQKQTLIALLSLLILAILLVTAFSATARGLPVTRSMRTDATSQRALLLPDENITAEFGEIASPQYLYESFPITVTFRRPNGGILDASGPWPLRMRDGTAITILHSPEEILMEHGVGHAQVTIESWPGDNRNVYFLMADGFYLEPGGEPYDMFGRSDPFTVLFEPPKIKLEANKAEYLSTTREVVHREYYADVTISGRVTETGSGEPIAGASITVISGGDPAVALSDDHGYYSIDVHVDGGQGSSHIEDLDFTLAKAFDIEIGAVEITQVIQCMDDGEGDAGCEENSVPLVLGKATVIRVFPKIVGDLGSNPLLADAQLLRITPAGGSISSKNGPITLRANTSRRRIDDSWNFRLPLEWTTSPQTTLEVQINPEHSVTEANYENNVQRIQLDFETRSQFVVLYLPIRYAPPGSSQPVEPSARINKAHFLTAKLYPLRQGGLIYKRGKTVTYNHFLGNDDSPFLAWLNKLYWTMKLSQNSGVSIDQLHAWLAPGVAPYAGSADLLGRVGYSTDTSDGAHTLAHEMAHNLGRHHPSTADACGAVDRKTDWPFSAYHNSSEIQEYGFDPFANGGKGEVKIRTKQDLMTYCAQPRTGIDPIWISPFTYGKLFAGNMKLQPIAQKGRSGQPQEVIMVTGLVTKAGTGELEPVWRMQSLTDLPEPTIGHDYCLEFSDGAGQNLLRDCFDIDFVNHRQVPQEQETFFRILPFPPGTQRLDLKQGNSILASRAASDHLPLVNISSPAPGDFWAGIQTIRWQATDADGDALVSSLIYSHDGGNSWLPLAVDLEGREYELDTSELPGGDHAIIRLFTSDGFHTVSTTVSPFTVASKPPKPVILAPADNSTLLPEAPLLLVGDGYDPEDGALSPETMSWSSDIDGFLGTGSVLTMASLSEGIHTLTLKALDSEGNEGTDSVRVYVMRLANYLPLMRKATVPTATTTPTPTPSSSPSSTPSPTPSRTPTPTLTPTAQPPAVTLVGVGTTNSADLLRMGFVPNNGIKLWLRADNAGAGAQDFSASWEVFDPKGDIIPALSWSGVLNAAPGITTWSLERTLPAALTTGQYTFRGSVVYGGQSTSDSVVFYVADSVALSDDFSDPQSGWPIAQTGNYTVGYRDGEYQILFTVAGRLVRVTPGLNLTGSVLEVVAHNANNITGDYGLMFALDDGGQRYTIFLVRARDGSYALFEHTPAGWTTIQTWTTSPWLSTGQGRNHLMTIHRDGTISVYANGRYLQSFQADGLTGGRVGLVAQAGDQAGVDVRFDDFSAYRLIDRGRTDASISRRNNVGMAPACSE